MTDARHTLSPPPTIHVGGVSTRSADFKDIYTNNTRVGMSPWDMSLIFALAKETQPGILTTEDQAIVRMSPQQFKTFVSAISASLQAWEEVFGAISVTSPPASMEGMRDNLARMKEAVFKGTSSASAPPS